MCIRDSIQEMIQRVAQDHGGVSVFAGVVGSTVPGEETIEAFGKIADGDFDHIAEQAFFNIGGLEDLERNWARIQKEYGA